MPTKDTTRLGCSFWVSFVDPTRFNGTIYKAANWTFAGYTKGYQRIRDGYSNTIKIPKKVFVQPVQRSARTILSSSILNKLYQTGGPRMKLSARHMKSLPYFFTTENHGGTRKKLNQ